LGVSHASHGLAPGGVALAERIPRPPDGAKRKLAKADAEEVLQPCCAASI
jgi:hypothetical protein